MSLWEWYETRGRTTVWRAVEDLLLAMDSSAELADIVLNKDGDGDGGDDGGDDDCGVTGDDGGVCGAGIAGSSVDNDASGGDPGGQQQKRQQRRCEVFAEVVEVTRRRTRVEYGEDANVTLTLEDLVARVTTDSN